MNDGRLLGMLTGAPHEDAWLWWKGVHHAIDLTGAASGIASSMSAPFSSTWTNSALSVAAQTV